MSTSPDVENHHVEVIDDEVDPLDGFEVDPNELDEYAEFDEAFYSDDDF